VPEPTRFFATTPGESPGTTTGGHEPASALPGRQVWS
jgi:hypothetical protein